MGGWSVHNSQKGQSGFALLSTLICLAVGSLIVAATLGFVDTTIRGKLSITNQVKGTYAAEGGVEDVLACLDHSLSARTALPQAINANTVAMQTEDLGERSFYAGEWVTPGGHSDWLIVSGNATWDGDAGAYLYSVNITYNAPSSTTIHLMEVGVALPPGYAYRPSSAAQFGTNLSTDEPNISGDNASGFFVNWVFGTPRPSVTKTDKTKTQRFFVDGPSGLDGDYCWVVAAREDIGYVSELTGHLYRITSTATSSQDGQVSARVQAMAIISAGHVYVLSWRTYN